ncbi:MAG: ribbon-helix-helix domain-containing protein [Thermoplasmata archaeon]
MSSKTSRLNLRVSDETVRILEEIMERKGLGSISDVIRDALDRYVDDEGDSWNSGIVKVKIPKTMLEDLENLVMAGDATDVQQAMNFALRDWIEERKQYLLEGRDALRKKVSEVLSERVAKEKLKSAAQEMSRR